MKPNKSLDIAGTLLLAVGLLLAFLPHAAHVAVGLGDQEHSEYVIVGLFLTVVALGILIYNNNALKK